MRINPIHIFLNECLYIINARISIELTFLKELMLIKQVHQKCVIFLTIGISKIKFLYFNKMSAIDAMIY